MFNVDYNINYEDELVRAFGLKFMKYFGCDFIEHPNDKEIDIISTNSEYFGVELELGGWYGDYWENNYYPFISNLGFATVNMQIRKQKYWFDKINNKFVPNYKVNFYIRTNRELTQAIVIGPKVIKNKENIIFHSFKVGNSPKIEDWMCFRRENVLTYDLKDGNWILQKNNKNV